MKTQSLLLFFEFQLLQRLKILRQSLSLNSHQKLLINVQVSGGKDSIALLQALNAVIHAKINPFRKQCVLIAQHFNHGKRGEDSLEDALFVAHECLSLGVPLFIEDVQFPQKVKNFQNEARDFRRYHSQRLCERFAKEIQVDRWVIATAHHASDHVESVLQHLLRGCGTQGLLGIQELVNGEEGTRWRPFSKVKQETVINYIKQKGLLYREDASNAQDDYGRNYLRHHVLPHFKHINPHFEEAFMKMSEHIHHSLLQEPIRNLHS